MAYDWSQVYEQQATTPTGNQGEMQILERRSQLEAQQKQRDFENQLELLRQSAEYNNATTKKRIEMEARLFAMQKQFLPTEMTGDLLGIPQNKSIESESASYKNIGKKDNNIFGEMGAGAGAIGGMVNRANVMSPLSKVGAAIPKKGVLSKLASGALTKLGGKSLGKVGGAIAGGVPGFLIGTAVGKIIEQLLEGNDEDKARAEYLINQYK